MMRGDSVVKLALLVLVAGGCRTGREMLADEVGEGSESEGASSSTSESDTDDDSGEESASSGGSSSSDSDSSDSTSDSTSDTTDEPPTVETIELAYGDDFDQTLDLYLPEPRPAEPLPTLVLAHGGLWQAGSKYSLAGLCERVVLQSGGTQACASIDYRLSQDLGGTCMAGPDTYVEQLHDFADAYVLLQEQSEAYGLDPTEMLIGGHSAGGHLAHALNLRWPEFEGSCIDCPDPIAAIGIEGIYDIPAWDAYDQTFWNGSFACATRKAFGDPPSSPQTCVDGQFDLPCWDIGSPTYLATHAGQLGLAPAGNALMIHSPGDDWVDIAEAGKLGAALEGAFPDLAVIVSDDGTCAAGSHEALLAEPALAACLIEFVASGGTAIER